jgi:hypothetical protein
MFAPKVVLDVGLSGCTFPRFETGWRMKRGLVASRTLTLDDISDHATGRACDLRSVTLLDPQFCRREVLELTASERRVSGRLISELPFRDALNRLVDRHGAAMGLRWPGNGGGGVREFWAQVEELTGSPVPLHKSGRPLFTEREWTQLRLGTRVRRAMIESGFEVLDQAVNSSHQDHFHFAVPDDEARWSTLSDPARSYEEKAAILEPRLRRAGGR